MKTKITVKKAADDISKEEPVLPPDDVNEGLLEFGELIDDICSDYVEEELFNSGDAIDNYDIFYNQNNEMFLNDNIVTDNANQGNPESLLEYFNVGEEVSVATNNPEEQLSTTEIDSINNLYEAICNENQQQAANIQELFNLPIDKPEQLNPQPEQLNPQPEQLNPQPEQFNPQPEQLNPQQDISYVNHIDTELGQNIWYDDNLENIVPNFECDMLSFSDSDLSDSDEQQGNGNKSAKSLKTLIDHAQYTITADLNDNSQTHLSLYDSLCDESFPTIENQLPSVQTSNCNSIFSDKTIVNSPSTFQNSINFSNSSDKYITHVNRRNRSKIKTSKFQNVMKIQNVYMKYCVVDSHSKLHVVNKADKMVNLMTKHLNKPQTSEADKTKRRRLLSKGTKGTLDKINNEKSNPMKMSKIQLFLEVKNVNRVRKFDFSDESFMLDFFSCLERSPRAYSELRKVNFVNNNEKIKYYTGIPGYQYFVALLNCLNLPSLHVASSFEMLLLTLVKMKLNLDWTDIAFRFGENVECIKNVFGYTVSIILECIPKLIQWLPEFTHVERGSLIYYIYKIDLMSKNPSDSLVERIYVCFSNSTHPVLFVSNPTTEVFSTSAELLEKSGIRQGVEHGDIIVFDNKVALHLNDILYSLDLSKQVTNTIPLDKRVFQCETYREGQFRLVRKSITTNKRLMNQLLNVQKRVSQMYSYNFLNDLNRCEYLNNSRNHELFYDVLRIVCGLMNLCNTLPFSLNNVKKLMDERKNLKMAPLF